METHIDLERAIALLQTTTFQNTIIDVPLAKANGFILACDIIAPINQPPFSKSAMDGYAFYLEEDVEASYDHPLQFDVVDCIYAGSYSEKTVASNQCVRIMTGARVPDNCNAVIRYEDTNNDFNHVEVYRSMKIGQNICFEGEDIQQGEILLKKGEKLDYVKMAILSSMGISSVQVYQKLKIALCVTGSEVVLPEMSRGLGQIYDSNMMLLTSRLEMLGYSVSYQCLLKDDALLCAQQLEEIAGDYDLIITTGGVSVGDKDIMHDALDFMKANKIFWKVNLKPGTPVLFSLYNNKPILSLSGNPFAASVTFELLARVIIAHMQQDISIFPKTTYKICSSSFEKYSPRRRFIRGIYQDNTVSIPVGMHSSNELRSMIGCNCIIDVPQGHPGIKAGDEVKVWLM